MNKYELAVVISGKLEEDDKNAVLARVKELIERFDGVISNVNELGKKRFAFEVNKTRDGYYNFIRFEAPASAPAEIERRVRIMDNVVRYLIVNDDLPQQEQQEAAKPQEAAPAQKSEKSPEQDAAEEAES